MRRLAVRWLALAMPVALSAPAAYGAAPDAPGSAVAIAQAMLKARYSDGFEARMNITRVTREGQRSLPVKLAVVGQIEPARGRLAIRGIAPERVRNRFIAAARIGDGPIRAVAYRDSPGAGLADIDPSMRLFDSDLIVWDMFAPWWSWPEARLDGQGRVAEDDCVNVRSHTDADASPIREVVSCVDRDRQLSLRTQLYDSRHSLVRTIVVEETMRKESGRVAARKLSITGADRSVTEVEVYSGDEDYSVPPDTFAALDAAAGADRGRR